MVDVRKIGAYISNLRKENDWTQMELANQLNVSHQAVSKWERGESLPDIGTLSELARLFEKTIDDILYVGHSIKNQTKVGEMIETIIDNRPEHAANMINDGTVNIEDMIEVAPLVKVSSLQKITKNIKKNKFDLAIILQLAPFLDQETLDELVTNVKDEEVKWELISGLAPFISKNALTKLADTILEVDAQYLGGIAPFLDKEYIKKLVFRMGISDLNWESVHTLVPFLDQETIHHLVDQMMDNELNIEKLASLAPFISQEKIIELLDGIEGEQINTNTK